VTDKNKIINKLLSPLKETLTKTNISDAKIHDVVAKLSNIFTTRKFERLTHQQHISICFFATDCTH